MNWDAIGAVGEVVGAFAVVISLIYLATQIRAGTRAARSQNIHTQTEQMQRVWQLQTSPEMARIQRKVFRDNEDPTYEEGVILESMLLTALTSFADQHQHSKEGLNSATHWKLGRRRLSSMFLSDWPKSWWREGGRHMFDDDFVAQVDELISRMPSHSDPYSRSFNRPPGED